MKDKLLNTIVEGLQSCKAHDIKIIDMSRLEEAAFNYFVVCEGNSSTQVYGIANNLMWIAIDYGYILVHVFQPETRQFYSLESLWEDASITSIENDD